MKYLFKIIGGVAIPFTCAIIVAITVRLFTPDKEALMFYAGVAFGISSVFYLYEVYDFKNRKP